MDLHFHLPLITEQRFDAFLSMTADPKMAYSEAGLAWRQLAANLRVAQLRKPNLYQSLAPKLEEYVSNRPDIPPALPAPPVSDPKKLMERMAKDESAMFCGISSLSVLDACCAEPPPFDDGRQLPMQVVVPSATEFLDFLRRENWTKTPSPLLTRSTQFWVGRSWETMVRDAFLSNPFSMVPKLFIGSTETTQKARALFHDLKAKRAETTRQHLQLRQAELDLLSMATLARWVVDGAASDRERRILVVGNRFSGDGALHHRAVCNAFQERGWSVKGLIEGAATERMNRHAIAGAVAAFRPHLLMAVHQPACDQEDAFPANLPAIGMRVASGEAHEADRRFALSIHLAEPFDPEHLVVEPRPGLYVAPGLYQPPGPRQGRGDEDLRLADYGALGTKAVVAHVGDAPLRAERQLEALDRVLKAQPREVREAARSLTARLLGGHDQLEPTPKAILRRLRSAAPGFGREQLEPVVEAMGPAVQAAHLLHTLRMARLACSRVNASLVLHGNHWERHSDLKDLAHPRLRRPAELAHMAGLTLCTIEAPVGCVLRQSTLDLIAAGSLVLVRRHPFHAALEAFAKVAAPLVEHGTLGAAAKADPEKAPALKKAAADLVDALPHTRAFSDPLPLLQQSLHGGLFDEDLQTLPGLADLCFGDEDELGAVLTRLMANRAEAGKQARLWQHGLEQRLTLEAHLRRALADVAGTLKARSDEDDLRMAHEA